MSTILFMGAISVLSLLSLTFIGSCSGGTITVSSGQSIKEAINLANEGDTIFVKVGNYCESNILVNKTVKIVGGKRGNNCDRWRRHSTKHISCHCK